LPAKEALHREFGSQGLAVVGVSIGESVAAVIRFRQEFGITYPLLVDGKDEVTPRFNARGHPTTILIGWDGRIIGRIPGERDWGGEAARDLSRLLLAAKG
jgi:peroxiredoxin